MEYAEQMVHINGKIHQNEVHLSQLAKNQTTMLDPTINILQRDQLEISKP